ncbi:polyketide synthase PksD [Xylaria cf. heliscus]|nr:polyketide synthase PksD [Xylaria cf. heliscus]
MEPIAIIGLSFKLPQGIHDADSFWDILSNRKNVMTSWPKSRANIDAFHQKNASGANIKLRLWTLNNVGYWKPHIMHLKMVPPLHKLRLDKFLGSLIAAGISLHEVAGTDTSVFSSSMTDDFMRVVSKDPENSPVATATGTTACILANRLSWFFDLKGPSVQINTACSSSMVALDIACQTLRSGKSSMALATGSNILLSPETSIYLSNMNFLSPDGVSYSFDHRANGYARGEGVVVLVLKRLSDAIKYNCNIRAVIRATGSNQDGRTPGLTQPSLTSQEDLIRSVYKSAKLGFESTRYVEAHGTGTQVGDTTEARALGRIFSSSRSPKAPLGSVKANIGHLEGCSGLAGVVKSILILERGLIPPNALFERWNPKINAKAYNLEVPTSCIPWPSEGVRRISVNSFGFGGSNGHVILDDALNTIRTIGLNGNYKGLRENSSLSWNWNTIYIDESQKGDFHQHTNGYVPITNGQAPATNGHTAVTNGYYSLTNGHASGSNGNVDTPKSVQYSSLVQSQTDSTVDTSCPLDSGTKDPNISVRKSAIKYQLLVWSARDESALQRLLQCYSTYYATHICSQPDRLGSLAYTLAARRTTMAWRSFTLARTEMPLEVPAISSLTPLRSSREHGLAFIFTGQGAQYSNMGRELLCYPKFRTTISTAAKAFENLGAEWSLLDVLQDDKKINLPEISQPLCTALQIALIELLRDFNIVPDVVVGHSSGEIAAAYCIGALSIESSCTVAYHRGRLASHLASSILTPGAMISVNLAEKEAQAYITRHNSLGGEIHIACVNSMSNVTLSGDETAIDNLKYCLEKDQIFALKVPTGVAYHSPAMSQIAEEYLSCLGFLSKGEYYNNKTIMISSVTGYKATIDMLSTGEYWANNLVLPVRFADALQYLVSAAPRLDGLKSISDYVEIGPHGALQRPIKDTITHVTGSKAFRCTSVLSRKLCPLVSTMQMAGHLFVHGYPVSVTAVNQQKPINENNIPFLADTPEYPFDHSVLYWQESRLSRDWRLRSAVQETLLGLPTADWNPLEPRWRKILNLKDVPWVADHVIGNDIFFPATGMLAMAVEAVKQTVETQEDILGYQIKEAVFIKPIVIRAEQDTEIVTHLRLLRHTYEKKVSRFEVRLFACMEDQWAEAFRATIHIGYREVSMEVDGGHEDRMATKSLVNRYEEAKKVASNHFQKEEFYRWLHEQGLKYGKLFALAEEIYWDGDKLAVATIEVPRMDKTGILPAVLDASCHVCVAAPSNGITKSLPTMVPARMQNAWISAKHWSQLKEVQTVSSSALKAAETGIECCITVLTKDGLPLYHVEQFEMLPITGSDPIDVGNKMPVYGIDWRPDLTLMSGDQLRHYCDSDSDVLPPDDNRIIEDSVKLEGVLRAVLQGKVEEVLGITDWSTAPAHLEKYFLWLQNQIRAVEDKDDIKTCQQDIVREIEAIEQRRPSWKLFVEAARDPGAFIRGGTSHDQLLALVALAQNFYSSLSHYLWGGKVSSLLKLAAHQNPNQVVLNLGTTPWNITSLALSALQRIEKDAGGIAYSKFVMMGEEVSTLQYYKDSLAKDDDRVTFHVMQDIATEDFESGVFDLIIVNNDLRSFASQTSTLTNLHRALKPGGHLIIHDLGFSKGLIATLGICALPVWQHGQILPTDLLQKNSEETWDKVLKEHGYTGNGRLSSHPGHEIANQAKIIFSTMKETAKSAVTGIRVILLVANEAALQSDLILSLKRNLLSSGYRPEVFSIIQLLDAEVNPDDVVVWLADMDKSLLDKLSSPLFELLRGWIKKTENLLWVTSADRSTEFDTVSYPHSGLKDGFLRSIRLEFNDKRVISLSLEDVVNDVESHAKSIMRVFLSAFETSLDSPEVEYIVRDGLILTGRLVVDADVDTDRTASLNPQIKIGPWNSGPPLKLDVGSRGSLDTLRFVEDEDNYLPLGPTEVEIEAKGWGLNFRDVFIALGRLEENDFGTDCAGVVTRVGTECRDIAPGDRVCMCTTGCMKAYPRADQIAVVRIPDTVSFETACAVIGPAITAWYSLIDVGRLQKGETILIHSASGATGQLAIQVAKMMGAEVFVTVGSNHKKELLKETYGIPDDHIFYSRNISFARGIMRVTDGIGVDMVLNSLVGESLRASWDCIAPYGRFIEIGKADIRANTSLPMGRFAKNVSFMAVDLRHIMLYKQSTARNLLLKALDLLQGRTIYTPKPLHLYDVRSVEEAFRYFQSGKNTGRTVITIDGDINVKKQIVHRRTWSFNKDSTYMVVGGLGGVGRLLLRWMVSRGARYILAPSRSGISSPAAASLVQEIRRKGVSIFTPKCDVSSEDAVSSMLTEYSGSIPPIHGCINAAMALNDSTFDKMRHAQWEATVRSKARTSWNLCKLLPKHLDFLIFLASTTGVAGNAGAPNYAAGCTFQDKLAEVYTQKYGGKVLSIDLGVMSNVGVVAETASLQRVYKESHGHAQVENEDLLALLDVCCDPTQRLARSQIVMGLPTPAELISRGLEVVDALQRPLLAHFSHSSSVSGNDPGSTTQARPRALFEKAKTELERNEIVVQSLAQKVARALSVELSEVENDKPLTSFGVDSLVAVELRNWMKNEFGAQIPVFEITGGKTIELIGELICRASEIRMAA